MMMVYENYYHDQHNNSNDNIWAFLFANYILKPILLKGLLGTSNESDYDVVDERMINKKTRRVYVCVCARMNNVDYTVCDGLKRG